MCIKVGPEKIKYQEPPEDGRALLEMLRVLKDGGKLLLVDYDYPPDRNILGYLTTKFMVRRGDLIKDIHGFIRETGYPYESVSIGAFKSAQLFAITKIRSGNG